MNREASRGMVMLLLCSIPGLTYSSDDPCRITYLHADKTSEARACEAAANAGNADAEFQYGLVLWSGDRPVHDRHAALEWIRKSARQGNFVAQITLGGLLKRDDVEPELRNPVEAYAWLVVAGDEQGAHKLRATFNESDAATADRMASDYKTKYAPLQAAPAGRWLRRTDFLSSNWPGLIVLGFFLATRRRLTRKLPFVVIGIVIAYACQYLAGWVLALALNAVMMRFPDQMLNAVVWTFGLAFVLSLLAPTLGVWALYRFWMYRRWSQASTM
jgi:TPR repeat protein